MKKIVTTTTNGGGPLSLTDHKTVFNDEVWDGMEALLSGYTADTEGLIVSGCVVGGSGPSSYTISAGIVFLDGEFMRLPAQTGLSLPQYIKADTPVNTQRTFANAVLTTLFEEKSATVSGSAPGAGQYIAITTTTDPDNRRLGRIAVSDVGTAMIRTKVVQIGDWNMQFSGSGSLTKNVAHGLSDFKKIRSISVTIRNDADSSYIPLDVTDSTGVPYGGVNGYDSTNITLTQTNPNILFNTTDFNATGYNRGFVTITYEG